MKINRMIMLTALVMTFIPAVALASLDTCISLKPGIVYPLGQITVIMSVTNSGAMQVDSVQPGALIKLGAVNVNFVSGPVPASISLAPAAAGYFTWVYTAATSPTGTLSFSGSAQGIENPSGLTVTTSSSCIPNYINMVSGSETATLTVTRTVTFTPTRTTTPLPSVTSATTFTVTRTFTSTRTPTPTYTVTPGSGTSASTMVGTFTRTFTRTVTPTVSPTLTVTRTMTFVPSMPDLIVNMFETTFENYSGPGDCYNTGDALGVRVYFQNAGSAAAGAFVVDLDGNTIMVAGLGAGAFGSVWFGPAAHSAPAVAGIDTTGIVAESNEANNGYSAMLSTPTPPQTCTPAAGSQTATRTFTQSLTPTLTSVPDGFFPDNTVITGGPGNEQGSSSYTDGSGNIYIAVLEWDTGCTCYVIYVYKYLPDGRLDVSFGTNGRMKCPGPDVNYTWNDKVTIKCDSSGRLVIGAYSDTCGGTCSDMIVYRLNPNGTPDTSFNGTGYRVYNNIAWTGQSYSYSFDFDSTGRIVICGKAWNGTSYDMIIMKLNTDGSLDTSFGTGGCVKYTSVSGDACGLQVICSGGKIYVTGYSDEFTASCSCVCRVAYIWRYNEDGSPDLTFGSGGSVKYVNPALNHRTCVPKSIAITTAGKIVITGYVTDGSNCDITCKQMFVCVFNSDGTPDTSFGTGGVVTSNPFGFGSSGEQILMEPDGKITIGGTIHNGTNKDMCVWKYNIDGSLDTTFNGTGYMIYDSGFDEECLSILRLTLCRKIASGFTFNGANQYDQILWNIEDMCPAHTETVTPTVTPTITATPSLTLTCACISTPTLTPTPSGTGTSTATLPPTPSVTMAVTETPTPTYTWTQALTPTFTATATATVILTPPCPAGTPEFTVNLVYNPENQDDVVMDITSKWPLNAPPSLVISAHGNCDKKPVLNVTATAVPLDATGTLFRYLYPKQTGWGDIDRVVVTGADVCGNSGTSSGAYTKETISRKDIILFKNVINPEKDERCRIVFKGYGSTAATVKIYNKNAVLIRTLFEGAIAADSQNEVIWDGRNNQGQKVVSGMYAVVVKTDYYTAKEKIAVVH